MWRTQTGIILAIGLFAGAAQARIVYSVPLPEVVQKSTAIVRVEVVSTEVRNDKCELSHRAAYRVIEVLKGSAPAEKDRTVWHIVPKSGSDCPVLSYATYEGTVKPPFSKGQQLIVFVGAQTANPFDSDARLAEIRKLMTTAP